MVDHDNSDTAFPSHGTMGEVVERGMSMRDYFAAQAMPAMISMCQYPDGTWNEDTVAQNAYALADAMLAERAK